MGENPLRNLPAVHEVLAAEALRSLEGRHSHDHIVAAVRAELAELREHISKGLAIDGRADAASTAARAPSGWSAGRGRGCDRSSTRPAWCCTPTSAAPDGRGGARAACDAARGYLNLELDLETGKRSSRQNADARVGLPADRGGVGDGGEQLRRRDGDRAAGRGGRARR